MTQAIHYAPGASTPLCNHAGRLVGKAGPPTCHLTRVPGGVTCRECLALMPQVRVVERFEPTHVSLNGDGTYGLGGRLTGYRADRIIIDDLDPGQIEQTVTPWWVER